MLRHPQSLTVGLSDPASVAELHVRVYAAPRTPSANPLAAHTFLAPFSTITILDLGSTDVFDGLEGYRVEVSVSCVGVTTESVEVFADNGSVLVTQVVQEPPTSVHINY